MIKYGDVSMQYVELYNQIGKRIYYLYINTHSLP